MEIFTLNRKFLKEDIIDDFHSAIWTERYYGDSEVELTVPATSEMIKKLPSGVFLGLVGSDEVMIAETLDIKEGKLTVSGISLLPWLNNRFIRTSDKHEDEYWNLEGPSAGWALWAIIYYMCVVGSPYLNGTIPTGITNPEQLAIPGLGFKAHDTSGPPIKIAVPFGPVYDAMRDIATAFEIGMQITLDSATDTSYSLGFRSYKGLDRTSSQTLNQPVRFSPQTHSFAKIQELESLALFKTLMYVYVPNPPKDDADPPNSLATVPGKASLAGPQYTGFDLRAQMIFASDITTDQIEGSTAKLVDLLNMRAAQELQNSQVVRAVDGEIVPLQFKYGVHYNLGDLIEVQGNSGIIKKSRVVEYIRAQDEAGERAYPTVVMLS